MSGKHLVRAAALAAALLVLGSATAQVPLGVELSADTSFSRSFDWSIDKSVQPESADRFIGETQELEWTITATRGSASDGDFRVAGSVDISNGNAEAAEITSITLMLGAALVAHDCAPGTLAGGSTLTCSFDVMVGSGDAQTLSVDVQTSGAVAGANDALGITFDDPDLVNPSISVEDTNLADAVVFEDSGSHSYSSTAACINGNSVVVDNTATIVGTSENDSEQARVACHTLRMTRNAFAGDGAAWEWDITKSHAETLPLNLAEGQTYDVVYTITATATETGDGGGDVTGSIVVQNTHPLSDAELLSVSALINGTYPAVVDCPSLIVPDAEYDSDSNVIYGELVCPFTVDIPEGETATQITGTLVQQLYAYSADGTATPAGTKQYTGTSGVTAGGGGEETDECVSIEDLYQGTVHPLGEFCADQSPVVLEFTGSITVEADSECEFEVPNLARFLTNDTGTEGEDGTVVTVVRTDCEVGCTRTQGYWKTHSIYGPAPHDDTWAAIGEDTVFFLATADGQPLSWYEVLHTAPQGNAYFNLAHQYIAASLNLLAGADASEQVLDAMEEATALFEDFSSDQIGALRGNRAPRPTFIELAGVLDMFNNGQGGLGALSCSEDDTSAE